MRVLVLGGTGAIGRHLTNHLSQNGIETFVTTRSNKKSFRNLEFLKGNAKDTSFLEMLLVEQWDAIIDFMVYSTDDFKKRVNLFLSSTSQYVFLSSARVYADTDLPILENSPRLLDFSGDEEYLSTDEYSLSKARQENILINSGQNNWTIIRPYITYSESRLQLGVLEKEEWLYRALRGRTIVFSSDMISRITTMTYGMDVSKGILTLIGEQRAIGNVFHITTNDFSSWDVILDYYLTVIKDKTGFRPKVLLQNMDKFMEIHPAPYQIKYDRMFNRRFDNTKIGEFIDIGKFVIIEKGLKNSLIAFLENPKFKNINWKSEALKDKQTNEKAAFNEIMGIKQKIKYLLYRYLSF